MKGASESEEETWRARRPGIIIIKAPARATGVRRMWISEFLPAQRDKDEQVAAAAAPMQGVQPRHLSKMPSRPVSPKHQQIVS